MMKRRYQGLLTICVLALATAFMFALIPRGSLLFALSNSVVRVPLAQIQFPFKWIFIPALVLGGWSAVKLISFKSEPITPEPHARKLPKDSAAKPSIYKRIIDKHRATVEITSLALEEFRSHISKYGPSLFVGFIVLISIFYFLFGASNKANTTAGAPPEKNTPGAPPERVPMNVHDMVIDCGLFTDPNSKRMLDLNLPNQATLTVLSPNAAANEDVMASKNVTKSNGSFSIGPDGMTVIVNFDGETTHYTAYSPPGIDECILLLGSSTSADLEHSWFSDVSPPDEPEHSGP